MKFVYLIIAIIGLWIIVIDSPDTAAKRANTRFDRIWIEQFEGDECQTHKEEVTVLGGMQIAAYSLENITLDELEEYRAAQIIWFKAYGNQTIASMIYETHDIEYQIERYLGDIMEIESFMACQTDRAHSKEAIHREVMSNALYQFTGSGRGSYFSAERTLGTLQGYAKQANLIAAYICERRSYGGCPAK